MGEDTFYLEEPNLGQAKLDQLLTNDTRTVKLLGQDLV